ncbi:uncharacterized protein LOC112689991 isoform X2 [Sipha flava]|uniref:Uncharacterized protein LOC112689991 isoform X2 n=1 Tax=Sipha flava TaxID=143950 RepID=A0A8B8G9X1_9HEMI|nr:uncharacterized protein LOC112689991 isoform X2 [Sipha flava]
MDPTKRDLKRKNTTLPYCTKTPRLQADNLSQNGLFNETVVAVSLAEPALISSQSHL